MPGAPTGMPGTVRPCRRSGAHAQLIDCGAGLWCVNIGYGRKEMGEAAREHAATFTWTTAGDRFAALVTGDRYRLP